MGADIIEGAIEKNIRYVCPADIIDINGVELKKGTLLLFVFNLGKTSSYAILSSDSLDLWHCPFAIINNDVVLQRVYEVQYLREGKVYDSNGNFVRNANEPEPKLQPRASESDTRS